MKNRSKHYRKAITRGISGNRGILLVSLALVLAVASVFTIAATSRTVVDTRSSKLKTDNIEAYYAAQAGEQAMLASIREDAMTRFAAFQASWPGTGDILTNPSTFFQSDVQLPGVQFPNGSCFDTVNAQLSLVSTQITSTSQVYNFQYIITSNGVDPDDVNRVTRIVSDGNFQISVDRQSFANYALFTNTHRMTSGTKVWFTSDTSFSGPVHTNSQFCFAYFPTFSDGKVSSVSNTAYFYNNGSNRVLDADHNAPRDVPSFGEGFDRGASTITLPTNAFDQRAASVGETTISDNSELRVALGLAPDGTPPPNGIYIPNDGASLTGGIYVQGNASDVLTYVDGSGNQCYQLTHSNGSTSNVVVDQAANQTIVNSVTYSGVPNGAIYVAGNVYSFGGPTRSGGVTPPAISSDTAASLFAEGDIKITRDLTYEDNPLTVSDATNVLGVFTPGGDIRIGTSAPDNIVIHSTLMTSDGSGVVQVDDYNRGSYRGEATILGGLIASYYGAFFTFNRYGPQSGYTRNFVYDQRLNGGIAPPFFPTTSIWKPADSNINTVTWASERRVIDDYHENFYPPSPSEYVYFYPYFG